MAMLTRKQFLQTLAGAGAAAAAASTFAAIDPAPKPRIKLGVTLYSYTGEYAPTTTLDGCIANAAAMGAEGIELLSETHIPNYPNPCGKWVEHWHGLMRKHKTQPSCYDCCDNSRLRKAGPLTSDESLHLLLRDMELARRLGFKIVRPAWGVASPGAFSALTWREMAQKALPYAEKYDIQLAPEINWSVGFNAQVVDAYANLIVKTKTRHLGLLLEGGGMSPRHSILASSTQAGCQFLVSPHESKSLLPLLPYILHLRGKFRGPYTFQNDGRFWELTDELQQYRNPFETVIPLLLQGGYNGYISSEYEGPRSALLASNHLGWQHAKLSRMLNDAYEERPTA